MILFNSVGKQFVLETGTRSNTGPQVQHGRRRRLFYDKKRRFPESDVFQKREKVAVANYHYRANETLLRLPYCELH